MNVSDSGFLPRKIQFLIRENIFLPVIFLPLLAILGWMAFFAVEKEFKKNLGEQLQSTLITNTHSFRNWAYDVKKDVKIVSTEPEVRKNLLALIKRDQKKSVDSKDLDPSPELAWLREYLGKICLEYGFIEFVVFDSTGQQVGAILEGIVGKRELMGRSDFFSRSMRGETVVSHPFLAETPLPDLKGDTHQVKATMFVSTPISNKKGDSIGVLAFRIRPEMDFSQKLEVGRFGESGETYAFDGNGKILSDSRFNDELRKIGLIPATPDSTAMLEVEVRDPGGNMLTGFHPSFPREQQPLTIAVKYAIKREGGLNVDGYNDYRGVPVVGAWVWLPEYDLGLVTEIDSEEAFSPLKILNFWFFLIFFLLVIATLVAFILRVGQLCLEKEQKKTTRLLQDSEAHIHAMREGSQEGIITIDSDGKIKTFNRAAEEIFGFSTNEVMGDGLDRFMEESVRENYRSSIKRYLQTGKGRVIGFGIQVNGLRKDKTTFPLMLRVSNIFLGEDRHFVGTISDITHLIKAKKKREQLIEQVHVANRELQNFAYVISHDLKAPLRGIKSLAQRIALEVSGKVSKGAEENLEKMKHRIIRVTAMIDGILECSQAEQNPDSQLKVVHVEKLLDETLDLLMLPEDVCIEIMPDMPVFKTNPVKLNQVFLNLIGNSVKYRNPEQCQIDIKWKDAGAFYEFSVSDNGLGIPRKFQDKVFDLFKSFNPSSSIVSTGVGLAIVKRIIETQGGKIYLESTEGKGSNFKFLWPKDILKEKKAQKVS